jgi:hypothetical protein
MARVGAPWPAMGSSPERGRGRGSRGRAARWRHGEREALPWGGAARSSWLLVATFRIVRKKEKFSELENFRGEK